MAKQQTAETIRTNLELFEALNFKKTPAEIAASIAAYRAEKAARRKAKGGE